jgi:hypothetical protein
MNHSCLSSTPEKARSPSVTRVHSMTLHLSHIRIQCRLSDPECRADFTDRMPLLPEEIDRKDALLRIEPLGPPALSAPGARRFQACLRPLLDQIDGSSKVPPRRHELPFVT